MTDIVRPFDQASDHPAAGSVTSGPDLDRYRAYVAHLNLPKARETDMLLAVRRIMQNFVDRAFGDDPVQRSGYLADKTNGKNEPAALPVVVSPNSSSRNAIQPLGDVFHRHAVGEKEKRKKR